MRNGFDPIINIEFQHDNATASLMWRAGWLDLESLIDYYEVSIVDVGTGAVISPPMLVGRGTRVTLKALKMHHAQRFSGAITAFNRAGGSATCYSDAVTVDLTPPVCSVPGLRRDEELLDGNTNIYGFQGVDMQFTWSARSGFMSWLPFVDPESGVENYWVWWETLGGDVISDKCGAAREWGFLRLSYGAREWLWRTTFPSAHAMLRDCLAGYTCTPRVVIDVGE